MDEVLQVLVGEGFGAEDVDPGHQDIGVEDDFHRRFRTRETAAETSERFKPAARA